MKITSIKETSNDVTVHTTNDVRFQIKKGLIITLNVDVEDGEVTWWGGKNKEDKKVIDKLKPPERRSMKEYLEETDKFQ